MNNLDKRIFAIEQKLNPNLKVLMVVTEKEDVSCEAAILRTMKKNGITKLPDDCVVYMINLYRKPAT